MKFARFFLKGVLLAIFTFFVTEMIEILLYVLLFSFCFVRPLAEGVVTADLSNPWAYFIMLPAILLSIFFSRKTYSLKENIFKANSLKEVFFEGFGWAAIQFGIFIVISLVIAGTLEQVAVYLVSLGIFIGPLIYYVFREFRSEAHMKKKSVITAIITIILFCVGVPLSLYLYPVSANTSGNTSNYAGINTTGNTSGNLVNGGEAALQGDWIYYSNGNDKLKIYKIKTDGTGESKLNDDSY